MLFHPFPPPSTAHILAIFLLLNVFTVSSLVVHHSIHSSLSLRIDPTLRRANLHRGEEQKIPHRKMAINCKVSFRIFAAFALIFAIIMPAVQGQGNDAFAPVPAPTSDGTAIDQGIAYGLMLIALVLTYIIHSFDVPFSI